APPLESFGFVECSMGLLSPGRPRARIFRAIRIIKMNNDNDKSPMERFEDLARKVFSKNKGDLKRPIAAEEDAEEVMEGGIPPTGEAADE
ncbi:MAG: hypothetical protein WBX26_09035, partial [Candidatus Cybelea sp.]